MSAEGASAEKPVRGGTPAQGREERGGTPAHGREQGSQGPVRFFVYFYFILFPELFSFGGQKSSGNFSARHPIIEGENSCILK